MDLFAALRGYDVAVLNCGLSFTVNELELCGSALQRCDWVVVVLDWGCAALRWRLSRCLHSSMISIIVLIVSTLAQSSSVLASKTLLIGAIEAIHSLTYLNDRFNLLFYF